MDASDRGVHRHHPIELTAGVRHRLHALQHSSPHAGLRPPVEVLVNRVPVPEPLRHVPPRCPGPEPPRGRLSHHSTLYRRTARRLHRWKQRLDHSPSLIRNHITRHNNQTRRSDTDRRLATRPSRVAPRGRTTRTVGPSPVEATLAIPTSRSRARRLREATSTLRQTSMRSRSRPCPAMMKSLRGATSLPMSSSNMLDAASASLTRTRRRVRWARLMVVSAS